MIIKYPLIILFFWFLRCQATLVLNLNQKMNESDKVTLSFFHKKEISIPLTFCLRFNLQNKLLNTYMLSNKDDTLVLTLRFSERLGRVYLNKEGMFFKIPKDNGILPYHWHHICVGINPEIHQVIVDGRQWSYGIHTINKFSNASLTQLDMGSASPNRTYYNVGIDFKGELSELNLWNRFLSSDEMTRITKTCGEPEPFSDILNWSKDVKLSNVTGNHDLKDINQLCSLETAEISYFRVMPHLEDQEGSSETCQVLGGVLLTPKDTEEFILWNGKYDDIVFNFTRSPLLAL